MSDYSNLFRGGGVSSTGRRSGKKGSRMLLIFIVLCIVATLIVWGLFAGKGEKNPVKEENTVSATDGSTMQLPDIKEVKLKHRNISSRSSISPGKLAGLESNLSKAVAAYAKEEFVIARDEAAAVVNSGISDNEEIWKRAADILGKANINIYMSDIPAPEKKLYTIQEGDNLITIAKRFGTTVEAIQKSNGLDPSNPIIFPGKTLYIYTGKWSITISKSTFRLYLYDNKKLFKVYKVGVGRQGRTPSGTFRIVTKQVDPVWYNEGRAIPFGDEKNVLGTRWMALQPVGKTDTNLHGYGIHGTWLPETIGTQSSNGCIRMKNEDVEELFSILPRKTEVIIKD